MIAVAARDGRTTGQGAVTIRAVSPEAPDQIAGELAGIRIAQEGTGTLVNTVVVAALGLGFVAQVFLTAVPVVALMIIAALVFMALNSPSFAGASFQPRRLLPLRQRLITTGSILAGLAIWTYALYANALYTDPTASAFDRLCGEPGAGIVRRSTC